MKKDRKRTVSVICFTIGLLLSAYGGYTIATRYANPIIAGIFYVCIGLLFLYSGREARRKSGGE